MPEVNQYLFNNKELLEMLVKQAGVHEGKWILMVNFGFSAGNFGTSPDQISPGGVIAILQVGIQRATPETPESMMVDAAVINPASSTSKRQPSGRSAAAEKR